MRAIGKRIQKNVGQRVAGDMFGIGLLGREHQTLRRDAGSGGHGAQAGVGVFLAAKQPEHAAVDFSKDAHPSREHLRGIFLRAVQAAKDNRALWKPLDLPCWSDGREDAIAVVGLVARETNNLFGIIAFARRGHDHFVGDDVMMVWGTHCAGEAEPVDVDWRGAHREDPRARALGITIEIDEDIDFVGADSRRRLLVGERVDVDPVIDGAADARADTVLAIEAAIVGVDFERAPVMRLHDVAHRETHRMLAEVRGDVADPQLPELVARAV